MKKTLVNDETVGYETLSITVCFLTANLLLVRNFSHLPLSIQLLDIIYKDNNQESISLNVDLETNLGSKNLYYISGVH
jgi:hypothetical protein